MANSPSLKAIYFFVKNSNVFKILSRGTVLDSGINTPNAGSSQSTQRISINQNMVPAFRVVAYYQVNDAEMVSASVWIDVVDQCKQVAGLD